MATVEDIKTIMAMVVNERNGMKATELAADRRVIEAALAAEKETGKSVEVPDLMDELVKEGQFVEVQYTVPDMPYRIKSFYLPKGSKVTICQESKVEICQELERLRKVYMAIVEATDPRNP